MKGRGDRAITQSIFPIFRRFLLRVHFKTPVRVSEANGRGAEMEETKAGCRPLQADIALVAPSFEMHSKSGKYGSLRGLNFSSWRVCPPRLESIHNRREDSSSRSAREARGSEGGKAHAAMLTPEGRSKSAGKAAKTRQMGKKAARGNFLVRLC
jgi:hypothetical protein